MHDNQERTIQAEEYLHKAAEAETNATETQDPAAKEVYAATAATWRRLATARDTSATDVLRDPLLVLLRRYETGRKVFDEIPVGEKDDAYWDRLAKETWYGALQEIIRSKPSATTAAGALMALDHVLQSDELFGDRPDSEDLQMLWQLIKGAWDYLASLEPPPTR